MSNMAVWGCICVSLWQGKARMCYPHQPASPTSPDCSAHVVTATDNQSHPKSYRSGFAGNVTFNATLSNGTNSTIVKVPVTLSVSAAAPPGPVAVPDVFSCAYGQVCAVAAPGVLSNDDSATPGTVLTVVASTNVSTGNLELQADGSFVYTPAT
jgi:hypothetical protein